jgi:hypothetical protein
MYSPPSSLFISSIAAITRFLTFSRQTVYTAYAALILIADSWDHLDYTTVNRLYFAAGIVHIVNACMYVWVWLDAGNLSPT